MMEPEAGAPPGLYSAPTNPAGVDSVSASGPVGRNQPGQTSAGRRQVVARRSHLHSLRLCRARATWSPIPVRTVKTSEDNQARGGGTPMTIILVRNTSSDESAPIGQPCPEPGRSQAGEQLEAAVQAVPKAAIVARFSAVFSKAGSWPTEVRKPLLAPMVTHQILKDTIEVCDEQCDSDGLALSQAFGNFDRRVAVSWLLADAAGKPLLERPQAHALGLKAQHAHAPRRRKGFNPRCPEESYRTSTCSWRGY